MNTKGGYVKSLAKQLSDTKTSPPPTIRHDNVNSNGSSSSNNNNNNGFSKSPSPTSDTDQQSPTSPGVTPNFVKSLIKAAEKQNNQVQPQIRLTPPPAKKRPSLPANHLDPDTNCNGIGVGNLIRKLSSPENTKSYSEKPPPKPNYLGQLSPKMSSPSKHRNNSSSPNSSRHNNSNTNTTNSPTKSTNSSSNSPSPSSPPIPSRKLSIKNGGVKPTIPQKPTTLATTSQNPRKPSLPSTTNSNSSSISPSSKPPFPASQQPKPPTNGLSKLPVSENDSDNGPVYAQVHKTKTKNAENIKNSKNNSSSNSQTNAINESCDNSNTSSNSTTNSKTDNDSFQTTPPSNGVVLRSSGEAGRIRRDSEQYRDSVFNTIYDNAAALSAAELFDSSWSDSDSYKDFSDDDTGEDQHDGGGQESSKKKKKKKDDEVSASDAPKGDLVSHEDKRFRIAGELLKTEQDYVAMLHLLHMVFYTRLSDENSQQQLFPSDVLKRIFSNTKSIYLFHNDFLLPQLEDRMKNWDKDPRIGDLMKNNAPFLKMYSEYINNFSHAMKLLKEWLEKSPRFSSIIQEIQKDPACGNLSLQHHMLGPIQRVPRYELLLKDYVKHLPADSPDMNEAKDALDLVTKAACHSNKAIEKIETFRKLLDIYQNLRGASVDFISPTREFVMQGPVTKISARSGEKQPRYIFLFNDLVLICAQHLLGTYNVRGELQVDSMEVKPGNNMNIPNTFMVHCKQKAVELLDETNTPERIEWEQKIKSVIETYKIKKSSIKQDNADYPYDNMVPDSCLGKTAPVWIPDDAATMCMLCGASFSMMRRRHHCRSCGKLVCKSCCSKAPLEYKKGKIERVCSYCYDVIVNKVGDSSPDSPVKTLVPSGNSPKRKGSNKVKASDPGLISGYLQCSEDSGKTWQRLWVVAHSDFVLYTFRAHEDVSVVSVLPLPGYTVETNSQNNKSFCLRHKKKWLLYQQDRDNDKKTARWISILKKLVKAELPSDKERLSTQSNASNNSSSSSDTASTTTTTAVGHVDGDEDTSHTINSHLDVEVDPNDEKADVRSQYDNVDPMDP